MVTVLRQAEFRFVIYVDDHEPAHVQVFGDGEARIDIKLCRALSNRGLSRRDLSGAIGIVAENQALLMEKWREQHG